MVSEDSNITSNHRFRGIAYVYIRLEFDEDIYPNGIPNISALVKGKKVLESFVNSKKYDLAFRLYPTNISQVISFAEKKKNMPQKSTWFHPKPLDGLISSKIIS